MIINPYRFQAGAAPANFPVILDITTTSITTPAMNHPVQMPAMVSNGDLLIAMVASDGNGTLTTPSGWTSLGTSGETGTTVRGTIYYRVADGTEGGTTVNIASPSNEQMAAAVIRIETGSFQSAPSVNIQTNTTNSVNPPTPSLSPVWGAADTLWLCGLFLGRAPATGFPLPDNQGTVNSMTSATDGCSLGYCSIESAIATLSPGTWTQPTNSPSVSATIAVRPAP